MNQDDTAKIKEENENGFFYFKASRKRGEYNGSSGVFAENDFQRQQNAVYIRSEKELSRFLNEKVQFRGP